MNESLQNSIQNLSIEEDDLRSHLRRRHMRHASEVGGTPLGTQTSLTANEDYQKQLSVMHDILYQKDQEIFRLKETIQRIIMDRGELLVGESG